MGYIFAFCSDGGRTINAYVHSTTTRVFLSFRLAERAQFPRKLVSALARLLLAQRPLAGLLTGSTYATVACARGMGIILPPALRADR